jgi:L-cystine uptake protein TcyP (sodium:dicarboxylate symporter family)
VGVLLPVKSGINGEANYMYEFFQLIIIPVIIGIVEVVKRAGVPTKYSPLVSLLLGLLFGVFYGEAWIEGIILGLMAGLSATGLYSGSKNIFKVSAKNKQNKINN